MRSVRDRKERREEGVKKDGMKDREWKKERKSWKKGEQHVMKSLVLFGTNILGPSSP